MTYGEDISGIESLRESANKIINAREAGKMIILCCHCSILYNGSVESNVKSAVRTIMIKPDNTLLVHSFKNYKPINWQTSNSEITIELNQNNELVITSINGGDKLVVTCYEIHKSIHYEPPENDSKTIVGTENDMHDAIINNPSLVEEGLTELEHEKEISVGNIDIYAIDAENNPVIIEVKRRKAQRKHIDQLNRYVNGYMNEYGEKARGVLVAPDITTSTKQAIKDSDYSFCQLEPLEIT